MPYSRFSKWTISSFILVKSKRIHLNKTMQLSYKRGFTVACNMTQCHQQRLVYLCQVQADILLTVLSFQFKSSPCIYFCWNGVNYSHSNGNKAINLVPNTHLFIKNYWSISEGIWPELESYDLNMKQRGKTTLFCTWLLNMESRKIYK